MKISSRLKTSVMCLMLVVAMLLSACAPVVNPQPPQPQERNDVYITSFEKTPLITLEDNLEVNVVIKNTTDNNMDVYLKSTVKGANNSRSHTSKVTAVAPNSERSAIIYVPDIFEDGKLTIELYDNAQCNGAPLGVYKDENFEQPRHWQIGLSNATHVDIGYTQHQETITKEFANFIDIAKELCDEYNKEKDPTYDGIDFLYQIESSYMLSEAYLQYRTADDISLLKEYIEKGLISVSGSKFNVSLEAMEAEEVIRLMYQTNRYLVDNMGIDSSSMIRMVDNPSVSKGTVDMMAGSGIKYVVTGFNGDRAPFYQKNNIAAYYMTGSNPNNKVLVVNLPHYNHSFKLMDGGDYTYNNDEALMELLSTFSTIEKDGYPFEVLPVALVARGDNTAPMKDPTEHVNEFNAYMKDKGYKYPSVFAGQAEEILIEQEAKFKDDIETRTGTIENWWNDGWGTAAYESGLNKQAQSMVPSAEFFNTFASLMGYKYDAKQLQELYEKLLGYDEHTWGYNAYDYNIPDYVTEWDHKRSYAMYSYYMGQDMLQGAVSFLGQNVKTDGNAIVVFNNNNWVRDDVISVEKNDMFPTNYKIVDADGNVMNTSESDGIVTFIGKNIPSMSYKVFYIIEGQQGDLVTSLATDSDQRTIENEYFKITFAEDGTISSLYDKANQREMVDSEAAVKFNQYNYFGEYGPFVTSQSYKDQITEATHIIPTKASVIITQSSNYVKAEVVTGCKYTSYIKQTVTLYDGIARVDIKNEVVRDNMPSLKTKEEAFYVMPFNLGSDFDIYHDTPNGYISPTNIDTDLIEGSCTDFYTVNKWVALVDNATGYNVIVTLPDTALMQYGERRTSEWAFDYQPQKPYLYSYVMNNQWHTNFQGEQPGYASFSYSISTSVSNGLDIESAVKAGFNSSFKLQSVLVGENANGTLAEQGMPLIGIDKENVRISTFKYAESNGNGLILRLAEVLGKDTKVTVTLPDNVKEVYLTDLIENDIEKLDFRGNTLTVDIESFDFVTLRLITDAETEKVENVVAETGAFEGKAGETYSCGNQFMLNENETDPRYVPANAFDKNSSSEWATQNNVPSEDRWVQVDYDIPVKATAIFISDRTNVTEGTLRAKVVITKVDGTQLVIDNITDLPRNGVPKKILLDDGNVVDSITSVRVYSLEHYGFTGGFSEIALDLESDKFINGTIITWDSVEGADYYELFRSNAVDGTYFFVDNITADGNSTLSYLDKQVTHETSTYYYKVRGVFKGMRGEFSDPVAVKVVENAQTNEKFLDTTAPTKPVLSAMSKGYDVIDLHWLPATDFVGVKYYQIYMWNGQEFEAIASTISGNTICTKVKGLEAQQEYRFKVRAYDYSNNYVDSDEAVATTLKGGISITASGEYDSTHSKGNAFDMNTATDWASDKQGSKNEWIKYSFGGAISISSINVVDRLNSIDNMKEIKIEIGIEGKESVIFEGIDITSVIDDKDGFTIDLTQGQYQLDDRGSVTYVKIYITDFEGNYAGFSEISIK